MSGSYPPPYSSGMAAGSAASASVSGGGAGGRGYQLHTEEMIEEVNDQRTQRLQQKVSAIRDVSIRIREELQQGHSILDGVDTRMDTASSLIRTTSARLGHVMDQAGSKHMCYLVLFCVVVGILVYIKLKLG